MAKPKDTSLDTSHTSDESSYHYAKNPASTSNIELIERNVGTSSRSRHGESSKRRRSRRKSGAGTLRRRVSVGSGNPNDLADDLIADRDFNDATEKDINDVIKSIPTTLENKKIVKSRVDRERRLSRTQSRRDDSLLSQRLVKAKRGWKAIGDVFDLWKSHLKVIEGQFGSGVASYFTFLKRIFTLNVISFFMTFCLIVLPQVLYRWLQQEPPGYPAQYCNEVFTGIELITGSKWFRCTELYYGTYHNDTINVTGTSVAYNMKYAYLLVCAGFYLLTLFIIAIRLAHSYRDNYINSVGDKNTYALKIFNAWDFKLVKEALLKHKSLFKDIQESLASDRKGTIERTCGQTCLLTFLRVITNLIVLGMLAGSCYLIWFISESQSLKNDLPFLGEMAMPLCVSAINFILPFAFTILASFERYREPKTELYITMIRTMVLYGATLAPLIYFWYSDVDCSKRTFPNNAECKECWETFMGEQIYKLIIVDFIFLLLVTFVSEVFRSVLAKCPGSTLGKPEFNIARNTLNLVYSQSLVWLGTFYSPLLSFIAILKLLILFYIKRVTVTQCCVPSVAPWRAGRTSTIFNAFLFIAFVLSFIAEAYAIVGIKPSTSCGPYRGHERSYDVITSLFDNWQNENLWLKEIITIVTSEGFMALVLAALCVLLYYVRENAKGHKEIVQMVQKEIEQERQTRKDWIEMYNKYSTPSHQLHPERRTQHPAEYTASASNVKTVSADVQPPMFEVHNEAYQSHSLENTGRRGNGVTFRPGADSTQ